MLSKVATTPRGNNSTGVEPNIDQGHNLNMAKKPTLDEMRLALTRGKTKHEHAHEKARLNAIKMLGLHEKNTAEDRARALGFDLNENLYHGTNSDFPAFEKHPRYGAGTYATEDPEIADIYAESERREGNAHPNVLPIVARGKKLTVSDLHPEDPHTGGWFRDNMAKATGIPKIRRMEEQLPKHGYDRLQINDMSDLGGLQTQHMFPDPSVIRSRFAAFDPHRVHENDLLAAKGGEVHMAEGGKSNDASFIGYLSPHGKFESYPESVAKANDYHHSHTVKDLDAYDAEGGLTFVRMGGEPIVSIKGTPAMDPFHHKHSPMVSDLARRIIASGGHPDMPMKVEDMGFKPHEAPYQNKHIGTLHEWSMRNVPKKAKGGIVKYPSIEEMLQKLREAGRTPIVPAPNRWFADAEKHPFQQKMIEKVLAHTGQGREGFPSGSYINPQTGEPMDFEIMHDLGVAIDPSTGRPMMSGIRSDLTEIDPKLGSITKSNLVRKGLFKHEGGDQLLKDLAFLATIEKSGKGHHYGLSTEYASPAELVNTMTGANPTLRPHSRGDIFGVGEEVGRISIQGKHHPVYEKLLVAPTGSNVQGKKLHKAKGGQVTHAHHLEIEERPL